MNDLFKEKCFVLVLFLTTLFLFCFENLSQAKVKIIKPKSGVVYKLSESQKLSVKAYSTVKNARVKLYIKGDGSYKIKNNFEHAVNGLYRMKDSSELPFLGIRKVKIKAYEYLLKSNGKYKKGTKTKKMIQVAYKVAEWENPVAAACAGVTYNLVKGDNLVAYPFDKVPPRTDILTCIISDAFKALNYWNSDTGEWNKFGPDYPIENGFPVNSWKCFFAEMKDNFSWPISEVVTPYRDPELIIQLVTGENYLAIPDIEQFPTASALVQSIEEQAGDGFVVDILAWDANNGLWRSLKGEDALKLGLGYAVICSGNAGWVPYESMAPPEINPIDFTDIITKLGVLKEKLQTLEAFLNAEVRDTGKSMAKMLIDDIKSLLGSNIFTKFLILANLADKYSNTYSDELDILQELTWDVYVARKQLAGYMENELKEIRVLEELCENESVQECIKAFQSIQEMPEVAELYKLKYEILDELVYLNNLAASLVELNILPPYYVEKLNEVAEIIKKINEFKANHDYDGLREFIGTIKEKYSI